jgi:hypothetical protein
MFAQLVFGTLLSSFVTLAQPILGADADKYCPKLPEGNTLQWSYDENSGFCLAHRGNPLTDITGTIGVSVGNPEGFSPKLLTPLRKTEVNGIKVNWYKMNVKGVSIGLQTLMHKSNDSPVHVWVLAEDYSTISELLAIASKVDFSR